MLWDLLPDVWSILQAAGEFVVGDASDPLATPLHGPLFAFRGEQGFLPCWLYGPTLTLLRVSVINLLQLIQFS